MRSSCHSISKDFQISFENVPVYAQICLISYPFWKNFSIDILYFFEKGDQSCVLIDTLESHEAAQEALVDIKKVINDKPIDAIILTHFHADHTGEFFDHKLCSRGLISNMKIFIGDCDRNFVKKCGKIRFCLY